MSQIHKLVYCSRNEIRGTPDEVIAEVRRILASARTNNVKSDISGALLFNEGLFAQVLEGPLPEVERIFEQIQQDKRHSDVTVLQCDPIEERAFAQWSMAFAGITDGSPLAFALPVLDGSAGRSEAGDDVMKLLHEVVVQEDCMLAG